MLLCCSAAGVVQHAAALRKAEALASPLLAYPWLPWKDENGAWQKASVSNPDFSQMTLSDLPSPELYLQVGAAVRLMYMYGDSSRICVLLAAVGLVAAIWQWQWWQPTHHCCIQSHQQSATYAWYEF